MHTDKISSFLTKIEELTKKPEKYLSVQDKEGEVIKTLTRDLYNFTKQNEKSKRVTDVLEELIIENLDEEQIWQQVELQNNSICNTLLSDIAHLLAKQNSLKFPIKEEKKQKLQKLLSESKNKEKNVKESNEVSTKKKKTFKVKGKSSVVDDKFFKLYEMENFLDKIERGEDDEGDDDINYFEDVSDLESDSEQQLHYNDFFDEPEEGDNADESDIVGSNKNVNENGKVKNVKFVLNGNENNDDEDDVDDDDAEYDVNPEDSDGSENKENDGEDYDIDLNSDNSEDFENNFSEGLNDGEEQKDYDDIKNDNDDDADNKSEEIVGQPSTFEARQERLKTRIQNLEEEALREKPWQLKGEVTATNRPQNSLLEEYVEFDIATRPAPVLTEKSTLKLEDVIIQRIKDKAWDDVVRKIKPVESDMEYKKKLVLDQEKSKLSLAQIYEQEYLKQLDSKNEDVDKPEVEPPEHQEIRIMMNKLFSKLDALSNFHFTPKQVEPEVKIVSNLPAISMEEVAPVAMSEAALLAPEEVRPKSKGDLIGKTERTKTDKKRERRQKKLKQKIKYKQMEAKSKLKPEKYDSKDSQKKKISDKFLQKITKSCNVTQLDESEGGKYIKSSNAFFSKLQNETSSLISKGLAGKKIKLGKNAGSKKKSKTS